MQAARVRFALEDWTKQNCGWEVRPWLGMSQIDRCPAQIYDQLTGGNGHEAGVLQAMAYWDSRMHKADLIERLEAVGLYQPLGELAAPWDGRFRGHPDGQLTVPGSAPAVLQIHTMPGVKFEELREHGYPRQAHYYQVQCYMLYSGLTEACILYKCRETGRVWPVGVMAHAGHQAELEQKARRLLEAVDDGQRPPCGCGHHNG